MIKKIKSSLTAKLFLLTALLLTFCCIATYVFIAWSIPKSYPSQVNIEEAEVYAYEATQELKYTSIEDYPLQMQLLQELAYRQFGTDVELHVFNHAGHEISLTDFSQPEGKTMSDYKQSRQTQAYSFTFTDNPDTYQLLYTDNSRAINQAMEALGNVFPYLLITILTMALFTAFIYSKYITAPIKEINQTSQKMSALDLEIKCTSNRTDELGGVSNNLNSLAKALSEALRDLEEANVKLFDDFKREKQMEIQRVELFSSISHELKTPITIVKGQLQGMIGGVGRYKDRDMYLIQSLETVNNLEKMVQELLITSRMETPGYICDCEPFDLSALIEKCLVSQEDLFIQRNMTLMKSIPQGLIYKGDQQLLKRVFDNLIINALTYSPIENSIKVSLIEDEARLSFTIENTGVHIEEQDLPQLFGAFFRADQSRNRQTGGSGLGLYIVKKILDLHNTQYHIRNSKTGIIFTILF